MPAAHAPEVLRERGREAGLGGVGTAAGQTGITVNTRQGGGPPDEWPSPFFVYLPMPLAASIDTKNPNPSPIGIRFGFLKCGGTLYSRKTLAVL